MEPRAKYNNNNNNNNNTNNKDRVIIFEANP